MVRKKQNETPETLEMVENNRIDICELSDEMDLLRADLDELRLKIERLFVRSRQQSDKILYDF